MGEIVRFPGPRRAASRRAAPAAEGGAQVLELARARRLPRPEGERWRPILRFSALGRRFELLLSS